MTVFIYLHDMYRYFSDIWRFLENASPDLQARSQNKLMFKKIADIRHFARNRPSSGGEYGRNCQKASSHENISFEPLTKYL